MKALVKFRKGVGNMEIQDFPEPKAGAEDVKIKVKACGICGTDIHILNDEFEYATPVILGHEFTGVIVERGEAVKAWEPGERVVAETSVTSCGRCRYCRQEVKTYASTGSDWVGQATVLSLNTWYFTRGSFIPFLLKLIS